MGGEDEEEMPAVEGPRKGRGQERTSEEDEKQNNVDSVNIDFDDGVTVGQVGLFDAPFDMATRLDMRPW